MYHFLGMKEKEDDQALLAEAVYRKPEMFVLDYDQSLFGNTRWAKGAIDQEEKGCEYATVPGKLDALRSTQTGATPFFLHTSGHYWDCYAELAKPLGVRLVRQMPKDRSFSFAQYGIKEA